MVAGPFENLINVLFDKTTGELVLRDIGGGGGSPTFVGLLDTPDSYTSAGEFLVRVNTAEDALEFITVSTIEGELSHDNLAGVDPNQHIDHSAVNLTAGEGLQGGGDLTADRSFALDVPSLSEGLAPDGSDDFVLLYDSSAGVHRKVRPNNLPAAGTGEANTASNVGVGGVGVFKQKSGVNLQFKNVNAGSSKVTVTDDVANDEIDVDLDMPTVTAELDITGRPSTTPVSGDQVLIADASDSNTVKRVDASDFLATGSGIPSGLFLCAGFVHTQAVASTTWTLSHGQGTTDFAGVFVVDTSDDQVFPDNVSIVDVNTIEITFTTAIAGKATVVLFL